MTDTDLNNLRIVRLDIENIKKIVAVHIEPDGDVIQITGKNGSGKTSVLDAIWWALESAKHIQEQPIREGADEAYIKLDMGKCKVFRSFKRAGDSKYTTKINVTVGEGFRSSTPDTLLRSLVNHLTIDPLEFARMKPGEQMDIIKGMVPGFDFDDAKARHDDAFEERTAVNRLIRAGKPEAERGEIEFAGTEKDKFIDEAALIEEFQGINDHNASVNRARILAAEADSRVESIQGNIDDLKRRLAEQEEALAKAIESRDALGTVADYQGTEEIEKKIAGAREINARLRARDRYLERKAEYEKNVAEADALTERIVSIKTEVKRAIEKANLPVPGLSMTEDSILLDGLPFDQASMAQKIRASMGIAMALNPRVRVVQIREGSLLDSAGMKTVHEMAAQYGCQVWIEKVTDGEPIGVVIEEGQVRESATDAANQTADPKPEPKKRKKAKG